MGFEVYSAPQACEHFSFHKGIGKQEDPGGGGQGAALLFLVFFP